MHQVSHPAVRLKLLNLSDFHRIGNSLGGVDPLPEHQNRKRDTMKKILLTAFTIVLVASCTKRNELLPGDNPNEIVFGSSIEVETKRTDDATAFDNGEVIGVYTYCRDAAGAIADFTKDIFMNNVKFTYNGTQFTSTPAIMWRDSKVHNFYAYYPTTLTVTNNATGATAPLTVVETTGIAAANDVMIANVNTLRYNGGQTSAELKFKHILSKVRFRIKKGSPGVPDAKLTNLEFKMKSKAGIANLVTGAVTNNFGVVKLSKDLYATPVTTTSTALTDVPGSWLVLPADEIREMILTVDGKKIESYSTIATKAGKITTITIVIGESAITLTSEIEGWGADDLSTEDLDPVFPSIVVEYGKAPFNLVGADLRSYTYTSYNDRHGSGGITNGAYIGDIALAYDNERPYAQFEIAKKDAYNGGDGTKNWTTLQGAAANHGDNICVLTHGEGWRIPRVSELKLIWENKVILEAFGNGFAPLSGDSYVSSTEYDGDDVWHIGSGGNVNHSSKTDDATKSVRCIKEIPYTPKGPVIEYGKPPYAKTGLVKYGSVTTSYNHLYGEGNATNGAYQPSREAAFAAEKPYYKFEVATMEAYRYVAPLKNWRVLQGTAADHSDNICVQFHGARWRLPRISELQLMLENLLYGSVPGLEPIGSGHWSATESSDPTFAWYTEFSNISDGIHTKVKTKTNEYTYVRCIKEL